MLDGPQQLPNLPQNLLWSNVREGNDFTIAEHHFQGFWLLPAELLVQKPVAIQLANDFGMVDALGQFGVSNVPAIRRRQHEVGAPDQAQGIVGNLDGSLQ